MHSSGLRSAVGGHCHGRIEGQETQKTAYYPKQMVESIARFWAQQNTSNRQIRWTSMPLFAADHEVPDSPEGELPPVAAEPPSQEEQEKWHARLIHFHKAAGHCSSRNLARCAWHKSSSAPHVMVYDLVVLQAAMYLQPLLMHNLDPANSRSWRCRVINSWKGHPAEVSLDD